MGSYHPHGRLDGVPTLHLAQASRPGQASRSFWGGNQLMGVSLLMETLYLSPIVSFCLSNKISK